MISCLINVALKQKFEFCFSIFGWGVLQRVPVKLVEVDPGLSPFYTFRVKALKRSSLYLGCVSWHSLGGTGKRKQSIGKQLIIVIAAGFKVLLTVCA